MHVVNLDRRTGRELQCVADIPLLGVGVLVIGIHYSPSLAADEVGARGGCARQRVDAEAESGKPDVRTRHDRGFIITWPRAAQVQNRREERRVDLLDHKERYVQESLAEVDAIAGAQDMRAVALEIPG